MNIYAKNALSACYTPATLFMYMHMKNKKIMILWWSNLVRLGLRILYCSITLDCSVEIVNTTQNINSTTHSKQQSMNSVSARTIMWRVFEKFLVQVLCAKPLSLNIHILEVRVKLKACGNFYSPCCCLIHDSFTALDRVKNRKGILVYWEYILEIKR